MIPPAQPPQYYQPQGAYPQYPQPPYPQAGYQPYAPYPQQPYGAAAGDGAATASIVCGAIGIFVFGLILGIIAIVQGNKAKSLGYRGGKATAGIVLGVLDLIGWAVIIIAMIAGALVNL
jgi:hypothetical protein